MSPSYLNLFLTEKISLHIFPISFLIIPLIEYFLMHTILNHGSKIHKVFSRSQSFLQSQLEFQVGKKSQEFDKSNRGPCLSHEKTDDGRLCREEVETMMADLGIFCQPEGAKLQKRLGSDDLFKLFEDEEPSLEEVKEAFNVFDENRDGFIDARELQRVLCSLGLSEGSKVENCRRMIGAYDENGDGRIDLNEFVKFMENSYC